MSSQQFIIDRQGKCCSCSQTISDTELIHCGTCKQYFHALCSSVEKTDQISTKSLLSLFNSASTRNNFKWFCDSCLTKYEANQVSTLENRFSELVDKVSHIASELSTMKNAITTEPSSIPTSSTGKNVWNDPARVQHVRSSLVVKASSPSEGGLNSGLDASKMKELKDIAVKNRIPVSNIGTSKNGHTLIHCPTAAARDKLNTILAENFTEKEIVPLKEKLPCITINDIVKTESDVITKDSIFEQIKNQNHDIAQMIDDGEEFKVLFIKNDPKSSSFSAVARVSCKIRDLIKSNRHRLFIGISSCRVYDRFYIKRCNNCQDFGHYEDKCTKSVKCGYCGLNHKSNTCHLKDLKDVSKLKCPNCTTNFPNKACGHSAF